jgi:hypothetical protein
LDAGKVFVCFDITELEDAAQKLDFVLAFPEATQQNRGRPGNAESTSETTCQINSMQSASVSKVGMMNVGG